MPDTLAAVDVGTNSLHLVVARTTEGDRFEVLTREKGASVLIDATTHQRAGAPARDFVRHADVVIRGRKEVEPLYGLPLTPGAVA